MRKNGIWCAANRICHSAQFIIFPFPRVDYHWRPHIHIAMASCTCIPMRTRCIKYKNTIFITKTYVIDALDWKITKHSAAHTFTHSSILLPLYANWESACVFLLCEFYQKITRSRKNCAILLVFLFFFLFFLFFIIYFIRLMASPDGMVADAFVSAIANAFNMYFVVAVVTAVLLVGGTNSLFYFRPRKKAPIVFAFGCLRECIVQMHRNRKIERLLQQCMLNCVCIDNIYLHSICIEYNIGKYMRRDVFWVKRGYGLPSHVEHPKWPFYLLAHILHCPMHAGPVDRLVFVELLFGQLAISTHTLRLLASIFSMCAISIVDLGQYVICLMHIDIR